MNKFMLNETSYHGAGAIQAIPEEIKSRGFKKAFVASDPDLVKFGVTQKVTDLLEEAGHRIQALLATLSPIPPSKTCSTAWRHYKACGADCIVAIGGGSSMDTAKAIGIIIEQPRICRCALSGGRRPDEEARRVSDHCRSRRPPAPPRK